MASEEAFVGLSFVVPKHSNSLWVDCDGRKHFTQQQQKSRRRETNVCSLIHHMIIVLRAVWLQIYWFSASRDVNARPTGKEVTVRLSIDTIQLHTKMRCYHIDYPQNTFPPSLCRHTIELWVLEGCAGNRNPMCWFKMTFHSRMKYSDAACCRSRLCSACFCRFTIIHMHEYLWGPLCVNTICHVWVCVNARVHDFHL